MPRLGGAVSTRDLAVTVEDRSNRRRPVLPILSGSRAAAPAGAAATAARPAALMVSVNTASNRRTIRCLSTTDLPCWLSRIVGRRVPVSITRRRGRCAQPTERPLVILRSYGSGDSRGSQRAWVGGPARCSSTMAAAPYHRSAGAALSRTDQAAAAAGAGPAVRVGGAGTEWPWSHSKSLRLGQCGISRWLEMAAEKVAGRVLVPGLTNVGGLTQPRSAPG
jgi:hypothetical protein